MNKDTLISQQALIIAELQESLTAYKESHRNIHNIIYCIGGPLNDNKLGYNKAQMSDFAAIVRELYL